MPSQRCGFAIGTRRGDAIPKSVIMLRSYFGSSVSFLQAKLAFVLNEREAWDWEDRDWKIETGYLTRSTL